MTFPDGMV